jgi:putative transposase
MSRTTSQGDASVQLLCATFGLSRQAYYAARATGRTPRAPAARAERPGFWASAAALEPAIRALAGRHPGWGVRKIWASLRRDGLVASRKRVWALMRHLGLTLAPLAQRREEAARGQVAVADSNRRWATDPTTVWTRQDGVVALTPVIDCGDRLALTCGVSRSQEAPAVLAPVRQALESEFGDAASVPDGLELRTDHGPQYTGSDCESMCRQWALDHTMAPVGRPTGNAVGERLIRTMKEECIWLRDWSSAAELRAALDKWIEAYNERRPHQALDWQTPAERRDQRLGVERRAA